MLKSLLRLFTGSKPFVPPTQKQLDYAAHCGVNVTSKMDRDTVSQAIDAALNADPKLKFKAAARRKRAEKEAKSRFDGLSAPLKREFKKWNKAADENEHFLVVYTYGKETVVDILECENAELDDHSDSILIDFLSPRIDDILAGHDGRKDVYEKTLCWNNGLTLKSVDILESRKIQIFDDQVKKYNSTIARKIKQLTG